MDTTPVVVHLIHGTWPYGFFRRTPGKRPAWFEDGSAVRKAIAESADVPIDFRAFPWSGRNSHAARTLAARILYDHIQAALEERPEKKHVIIAHSHGGTVAARCLALQSSLIPGVPRIKAFICLATPFTYLSRISRADEGNFGACLSAAVFAMFALLVAKVRPGFPNHNVWRYVAIGAFLRLVLLPLSILMLTRFEPVLGYGNSSIHRSIPTFILRGTRDEAALTIGLAQALNMVLRLPSKLAVSTSKLSGLLPSLRSMGHTIVFAPLVGLFLWKFASLPDMSFWKFLCLVFLVDDGITGGLVIAGYTVNALTVGFLDFRSWPNTIVEVDAVPPMKECSFKGYSDLEDIETTSLRHGLYENKGVQREIGLIIRSVALGQAPRLVSEDEAQEM
jgi:pimeloyl-ACP methyl ester carboxylesterase